MLQEENYSCRKVLFASFFIKEIETSYCIQFQKSFRKLIVFMEVLYYCKITKPALFKEVTTLGRV